MRGRLAGVRGWCVIAGLVLACVVGLSVAPSASAGSWASVGGPVGRVVAAGKVPPVPVKGSVLGPGGVVKADGLTRLTGVSPHTTAGQAISTRVACQLVVRGDLRACSVFRYSNGSVFVRTYGHQIILTVTWSAKANSTTTAYLQVGRWRTNGHATNLTGINGSRMDIVNVVLHPFRVANTWTDYLYGRYRTVHYGEEFGQAGYNNHQGFWYYRENICYYQTDVDTGLYFGNGYWLSAHNPANGTANIVLARYSNGGRQPFVGTRPTRFLVYDGYGAANLRIDDFEVYVKWLGTGGGYKNWYVKILKAPAPGPYLH